MRLPSIASFSVCAISRQNEANNKKPLLGYCRIRRTGRRHPLSPPHAAFLPIYLICGTQRTRSPCRVPSVLFQCLVASCVPRPLSPVPSGLSISYLWHFSGRASVTAILGQAGGGSSWERNVGLLTCQGSREHSGRAEDAAGLPSAASMRHENYFTAGIQSRLSWALLGNGHGRAGAWKPRLLAPLPTPLLT